jgi:photosystem I P700 chlorophyll a apoprotein A1
MQSDVWGSYSQHITGLLEVLLPLVSVSSSNSILWYNTRPLIFIGAHFVWALSLMFLFSGRGYWQELIESILWAHHKLKIVPSVQARSLSITQGRAVGLVHYLLGGIGCTWAFIISRMVAIA